MTFVSLKQIVGGGVWRGRSVVVSEI